jgi:carbon storage regulator
MRFANPVLIALWACTALPCEREFTLVLVVSRKVGERVLIGDEITVTVIKVGSGGVRIGIQAPKELAVVREELAVQVRKAEQLKIDIAQQTTTNGEQDGQSSPPATAWG